MLAFRNGNAANNTEFGGEHSVKNGEVIRLVDSASNFSVMTPFADLFQAVHE